jgi:F0F1-type ATP synthase membrane subunit b/b'
MAKVKRFLIIFSVFYIIVATSINMLLGPPAMSSEYLSIYKADHDHYLESTKNIEYKRWAQRPELNPEPDAKLQMRIDFIAEYETREAFKEEMHRRHTYDLLFEFFNAGMVIVLVVGLAKGPIVNAVDGLIASIREKLDETDAMRRRAEARLDAAERKIAGLDEDMAGNEELAQERIEHIRRESALFTGQSLSRLNKELENRKANEAIKAQQRLKEIAVDAAMDKVIEKFKHNGIEAHNQALVDQFIAELEKSS